MVDVTIDELLAIANNQLRSANTIIQQGGVSFKAPTRPNPPTQINVSSQAQLEAELGVNLEIADNERLTIVLDDAFTLTKPIKLGLNVGLELYASVNGAFLTYTGVGALFQNTDTVDFVDSVNLHNLNITGDGTNSLFALLGNSILIARDVVFSTFDSIGTTDIPFILFDSVSFVNNVIGLVMLNPSSVSINRSSVVQFAPTGIIAFSIVSNVLTVLDANVVRALSFFAGDSLFFLGPSAAAGSIYSIQQCDVAAGDVYAPLGPPRDMPIVVDSGGNARFVTDGTHGFVIGQTVEISGFVTNTAYNGLMVITAVTVNTFETGVAFGTSETTGIVSGPSLDQTDLLVLARGNVTSPDSMFNGESGLEIFGAEASSSSLAQNAFEVVTNVAWLSANLERFSDGVVNTGQLICNDPKSRRYTIAYSGTIEKMGGGSVDVGIILLKNGLEIAFNPPHTVNSGKIQISGSDLIELTVTDTIDIAVKNYDATAATILTSQLGLVVSKA